MLTARNATHGDRILVECPEALVLRFVLPKPVSDQAARLTFHKRSSFASMALPEMIYEAMHDLLFPFVACGFLVRFNDLEVGTLGAAVDGCTDLNELEFFSYKADSVDSCRRISALWDYRG